MATILFWIFSALVGLPLLAGTGLVIMGFRSDQTGSGNDASRRSGRFPLSARARNP